jgi:hypothetical protein
MMEAKFERNLFESKALLLMILFGFAGMALLQFENAPSVYTPYTGSSTDYRSFSLVMYGYAYLLNPVLLFIAFYRVCGKNLPEKAASTVISLFFGTIVGMGIGWLSIGGLIALVTGYSFISTVGLTLNQLQFGMATNVLVALAAVAWAMVVRRWDEMQLGPAHEWTFERPDEISVASTAYAYSGILTLSILPILFLLPFNTNQAYLAIFSGAVGLATISGISQLIIGRGLHNGHRWSWAAALVASLIGLALNVEVLIILALGPTSLELTVLAEVALASVSLFLNLLVIEELLRLNSRLYCRMVDIEHLITCAK